MLHWCSICLRPLDVGQAFTYLHSARVHTYCFENDHGVPWRLPVSAERQNTGSIM